MTPEALFSLLDDLEIDTQTYHHPPVATVAEAKAHWAEIDAVHCKNLFFKDAKGVYWLVVVPFARELNIKTLHKTIGAKRLSFGSADRLREVLAVEPGSVTPFALINDTGHQVNLVLDAWMMAQDLVAYHPLVNTMTTTVAPEGLMRFLSHTGHAPQLLDLSDQNA
ncbi:MAG: prolyl-tRNA synthetase associated domain-containing protein [Magnetospiraceae bacterium]